MKFFVKFTEKEGNAVWINPSHVVGVHPSTRADNKTDICTVKWIFTVKESVNEVIDKLDYLA